MTSPRMCHDCAFRKGSPERKDVYGTWLRIHEQMSAHIPFHCHQDMPVDLSGSYAPPRGSDGMPVGFPVCAGYLRAHEKMHRPSTITSVSTECLQ